MQRANIINRLSLEDFLVFGLIGPSILFYHAFDRAKFIYFIPLLSCMVNTCDLLGIFLYTSQEGFFSLGGLYKSSEYTHTMKLSPILYLSPISQVSLSAVVRKLSYTRPSDFLISSHAKNKSKG